jgi:hypothetical protein
MIKHTKAAYYRIRFARREKFTIKQTIGLLIQPYIDEELNENEMKDLWKWA